MNRSIEEGEPVVITRSWRPSPLKSPTVREFGSGPAAKWAAGPNVPSPRPRRTDTSPDTAFAAARSRCPSELKSPTTTGPTTAKRTWGANVPSPRPGRMDTFPSDTEGQGGQGSKELNV